MSVREIFGLGFEGAPRREKLERAARELEAVVLAQLLGAMRKTVPKSGLFGQSLPDEVFRSLLDTELARASATRSPFGLADALARSFDKGVKDPAGPTERGGKAAPAPGARFRRIG